MTKHIDRPSLDISRQLERDQHLIKERFDATRRHHESLRCHGVELPAATRTPAWRSQQAPDSVSATVDRALVATGHSLPMMPTTYTPGAFAGFSGPPMVNDLTTGEIPSAPEKVCSSGEWPPDDLQTNLTLDPHWVNEMTHDFNLHAVFPLSDPSIQIMGVMFSFRFTLDVEEDGTYSFMPLPLILGNVGYMTPGDYPGRHWVSFSHGVTQGGAVLDAVNTMVPYDVPKWQLSNIALDANAFLFNDSSFRSTSAVLRADDGPATIDVSVGFYFLNGREYHETNGSGEFWLDCRTMDGELTCDVVKWGYETA